MVYITYAKSTGMYASPDEISIYKKVLNGDSFEITSFYLSPKSAKPLDRDRSSESIEYHQNAVFTIRTDAGETEEFNIDVGLIFYKPSSSSYYKPITIRPSETYPYLRRFGIACTNETVYFEPYKEKFEYVYSNTQLIEWLKEKTSYIDTIFEKVSKVQKKKRELAADFQANLYDEVFDESEIENYQWHEYKK